MTVWRETLVEIPRLRFQITFFYPLVIKDWSVSAPNSRLEGGMKYQDGNWLCQSLDCTISTCKPTSAAMEGSMLKWMANRWPWLKPREQMGKLPSTLPVFSTWKQVTSSPFQRLLTANLLWVPFIPTLARIWFKNLMSGNCTITLTIKGINFFP